MDDPKDDVTSQEILIVFQEVFRKFKAQKPDAYYLLIAACAERVLQIADFPKAMSALKQSLEEGDVEGAKQTLAGIEQWYRDLQAKVRQAEADLQSSQQASAEPKEPRALSTRVH